MGGDDTAATRDEELLRALLFAVVAVGAGLPLYLALEWLQLLPVPLRDAPWPLELVALFACASTLRAARRQRARRRLAFAAAAGAVVLTLAFSLGVRFIAWRLPAPDGELPIGVPLPALELVDDTGARVSLRATDGSPSVLVFFRAASCPYCRGQLAEMVSVARRFVRAGVRVVGLCPDESALLARLREELDIPFELLSDSDERAVLALCAGRSHCEVVVDGQGVVRWATLSESWSDVPDAGAVLQAAYRLGD